MCSALSRNPRLLPALPLLLSWFAFAPVVQAVPPLVVDDADIVEPQRLELTCGWDFFRTGSAALHVWTVSPVLGLNGRSEFGLTFGYQWLHSSDNTKDAFGLTDLELSPKWILWHAADERFTLSTRLDWKMPTANKERELGSGNTDLTPVLIGTCRWGRTEFDWNVAYTFADAPRMIWNDDQWLVGQAVRHELTRRCMLVGEAFALIPQGSAGGSATGHFRGGAQFFIDDNLFFSTLVGGAVGPDSPDLAVTVALTWER